MKVGLKLSFITTVWLLTAVTANLTLAPFSSTVLAQGADTETVRGSGRKQKGDPETDNSTILRDQRSVSSNIKTKWGVFGNATTGMTYGAFGELNGALKNAIMGETAPDSSFLLSPVGSQYGGNVYVQIGNRLLIGAGGTGFNYTNGKDGKDSLGIARFNAGFITGNIGFILFQKYKVTQYRYGDSIFIDNKDGAEKLKMIYRPDFKYHWCIFPYVGFGIGSSRLRVSNYKPEGILLGQTPIERSSSATFTADMNIVDFGLGLRFRKGKKGGLMLGAELGGYLNVGGGTWNDADDKKVEGVPEASLAGGYLRLTVGGGFFKVDDPEAELEKQRKAKAESEDAYVPIEEAGPKPKKKKKDKKGEKIEEIQDRTITE